MLLIAKNVPSHTSTGRQSETVPDEREREGAQEAQAAAADPSTPLMMTAATRLMA